ncbi:hypothetical protein O181_006287 [Austropuccinia psidii MF-1]|uniref:Retrotransposon gag domain-containing protein n=1 Tax=Austropuccinia psidii MF-1 TaxID=1389203 RepID=A0A9Q3GHG6_9BASI|nr:hypothetical protein [Austropuccinia psidii MF-1]
MPQNSTPFTEDKLSVRGSLTPFLGENAISAKDIPKLEEEQKFFGEGEYNNIEFIRTIDMLQEDFHIPYDIIVGKLNSLFTRTAKKWYSKMKQEHEKHNRYCWKSEIITKWKDRFFALHPDMSDSMINMKILRKCGGELEHAIKCRCIEPCPTEDYINAMENIITRTRIGETWIRNPMESKIIPKISREDKKHDLKCHKCGSTSNLSNN